MSPEAYQLLDRIADAFNPLLAAVALAAPLLNRPSRRRTVAYYLCAGGAIATVYATRALDARYGIWSAAGADFSTHSAFAASLGTSLVWLDRRWLRPVVPALILYLSLVLLMRYHGPFDVASSVLLASAIASLVHAAGARTLLGEPSGEPGLRSPDPGTAYPSRLRGDRNRNMRPIKRIALIAAIAAIAAVAFAVSFFVPAATETSGAEALWLSLSAWGEIGAWDRTAVPLALAWLANLGALAGVGAVFLRRTASRLLPWLSLLSIFALGPLLVARRDLLVGYYLWAGASLTLGLLAQLHTRRSGGSAA